jgi:hypothetical protein
LQSTEDQYKAILTTAQEQSDAIIDSVPDTRKKKRENYRRIHDLSTKLLSDRENFIRPDAENLSKYAQIGGVAFIAPRTLINWYRDMIAVWVGAHKDMVAIRMAQILEAKPTRKFRDLHIDAEIQSLKDINRVLYLENCELRARLSNKEPEIVPTTSPENFHERSTDDGIEYVDLRPLRKWLDILTRDSTFLEITEVGLKVSRKARFGVTVMGREVYDLLKTL